MLKIENVEVTGWEAAIRGMRNPMNSWEQSDSGREFPDCGACPDEWRPFHIGPNDLELMTSLRNAGTDHRKFMRMLVVYLDITAPLYWWKEFKTYRAGRKFGDDEPDIIDDGYLEYDIEMNSCSTMHKIAAKEFTLEDFSCEHLMDSPLVEEEPGKPALLNMQAREMLVILVNVLNAARYNYLKTKDKKYWWQMIQLLPTSYNQKRTVMLNYEVLANIYKSRRHHKLDEWHTFCDWVETLPYASLINAEIACTPSKENGCE